MAMNSTYLNAIANAGASLIKYIGLHDSSGDELSGGDPAYARKAVTWTTASNGTIRPNADLTFDVPDGTTIGSWHGYSASSSGTDYGGTDLDNEVFINQGTYTLVASGTGIIHSAVS